ncbi:MAG: galactose mutarotase [Bacteroidetes bacterium]|nr:galactose mutarotase [Bacteroidota bacterium]
MDKTAFHFLLNGQQVDGFTIVNKRGMRCDLTNYGARVVSLWVPDRNGRFEDVVLGFDSLQEYLDTDQAFFGTLVGRYANRIAKAKFHLDGQAFGLAVNHGRHHIHGGSKGFHAQVWQVDRHTPNSIDMSYRSVDGEEGFPGNLDINVCYELTEDNGLAIRYTATCDKATPLNLTNHSYFNLNGAGNQNIVNHELLIRAEAFTQVDEDLIPTGAILPVEKTVLDFRTQRPIAPQLIESDPLLSNAGGFDHNYVLEGQGLRQVAIIHAPASGRTMEVLTDQPGLQFYSGNSLDGSTIGKEGKAYGYRCAFCLETQHFPDSPNHSGFPSTILRPGETFSSQTIYRFSSE